jgi:hypothetical protein
VTCKETWNRHEAKSPHQAGFRDAQENQLSDCLFCTSGLAVQYCCDNSGSASPQPLLFANCTLACCKRKGGRSEKCKTRREPKPSSDQLGWARQGSGGVQQHV